MMDGPEHSSHTGEGRREGVRDERNGGKDTEKMEIYVGRKRGGGKRWLEEAKQN